MLRPFLLLAAFFGFTGVALGAFAAHGLKKQLSAEYLAVFQTGVHYQLIHALALFGVALLATRRAHQAAVQAGAPGAWATPETGCLRRRTCRQGALVIGVDRARMPLPFTFVTVQPCRFN